MKTRITGFCLTLFIILSINAQQLSINPSLLNNYWSASWITSADAVPRGYAVYHFRNTIALESKPQKFIVHVSADNRYRLFVNGKAVCSGPSRGDLYNWYFETLDIAPFLLPGKNVIAALVWNMGEHAPVAQISNQTAFVLQGDGENEKAINTNSSWKVLINKSYHPCSTDNAQKLRTYMVVGPGDSVNAALYPWQWEQNSYDDNSWQAAKRVSSPVPVGYGSDNLWSLVPRNIPLMEESLQRIPLVRRASGINVTNDFLKGNHPLTVPANQHVTILLDQSFNTVAYPELIVSSGKNSNIRLTYAEALFKNGKKENRNEIEGKEIIGNYDVFQPDGGSKRLFRPLWFKTYRYLQLDIDTKDEPLIIEDLYGMYTGYPFTVKASFTSNDQSLQDLWTVGWRTARLCAGETYFDCPYYEQLQYEGDTRIQSLISLYVTGDDRLMRKAIIDFYNSRVPEGLTQGRYPSNRTQVIPPFSLFWVSMLHDYFMHRDPVFIKQFLTAAEGVLNWYENKIDPNINMLGPMKWWSFVDWNKAFPGGTPPAANNGNSSIVTLQYVYTLRQAAEVFDYFNKKTQAAHYRSLAVQLSAGTYKNCFDVAKNLMADDPTKKTFSQHAGIMGVLSGAVPQEKSKEVMMKVLYDTTLSQATFYYRFYLTRALKKAGMANLYYSQLKSWRDMLKIGLTTFAENPDPTRSDCHAWSASPNYDFFATICGINPSSPGFQKVEIKPALGELHNVTGKIPHPNGEIEVILNRKGEKGMHAEIILPPGLTGNFIWNEKTILLKPGKQIVDL
ncbi:MAG: alpha-L-rhamnosidase [Chitinophagaceae bacterium]|nr:alpha-L-rhamnosidase [Chitinophagaceae bacterium]